MTSGSALFLYEWKTRTWGYAGVAVVGLLTAFALNLLLHQRDLLHRHVAREAGDVAWMAFLKNAADRPSIEDAVRALPGIDSIRFISKDEALQSVQKDPVYAESLTLTGQNPLPDAFDVRWNPFYLRTDYLRHATEKVAQLDGVERVDYDRARVERLELLQRISYELEFALLGVLWASAAITILLAGRLLFFPRGPFPAARLASCVAAGLLGSAGGLAMAQFFAPLVIVKSLAAGAAAGLLIAVVQDAFQGS